MLKKIARTTNKIHKTRMVLRCLPGIFTGFFLEELMDAHSEHLPPGFIEGAKENLAGQRHGMETAFMAMNRLEDDILAPIKCQLAFHKATALSIADGTIDEFMRDPELVRERILASL